MSEDDANILIWMAIMLVAGIFVGGFMNFYFETSKILKGCDENGSFVHTFQKYQCAPTGEWADQ